MRSDIENPRVTFPMAPAAKQHALGRFSLGTLQRPRTADSLLFFAGHEVVKLQGFGAAVITAHHALRPMFRFELRAYPAASITRRLNFFLLGRVFAVVMNGRSRTRQMLGDRPVAQALSSFL